MDNINLQIAYLWLFDNIKWQSIDELVRPDSSWAEQKKIQTHIFFLNHLHHFFLFLGFRDFGIIPVADNLLYNLS